MSSSYATGAEKQPRSSRACVQCRGRKQRCLPELPGVPCQRCRGARKRCSFEVEVEYALAAAAYPAPAAGPAGAEVHALRLELAEHRRRLDVLERTLRAGSTPTSSGSTHGEPPPANEQSVGAPAPVPSQMHAPAPHAFQYGSPTGSLAGSSAAAESPRPTKRLRIDTCTLGAPISTLRNLGTLGDDEDAATLNGDSAYPLSPHTAGPLTHDPVERGILSMEDAERCFRIFFENLHQLAPLLCVRTQSIAEAVRMSCGVLFTSICAVGARYWDCESSPVTRTWLHPRYRALVELLDEAIGALLLRATPADVSIESVQALLVYLQWMPLDGARSRFNDVSAWSIAGLAMRQAHYIGLERCVQASFEGPVREEDMRGMRVWLNLLSIDHHLMLTSALPASLNPEPAVRVARAFGSHPLSQPTDIKATALCEIVGILHRAARSCGDPSLRRLDPVSLQRANAELDDWESTWSVVLPMQSTFYMPFTALRWYRLALNSVSLGSALARPDAPTPAMAPGAVDVCIEAAAKMLFHFSAEAALLPVGRPVRGLRGPFTLAQHALTALRFAIDSYWVTHAFAVVLLALAHTRGLVDDELRVLRTRAPVPQQARPRPDSLLTHLLRLAAAAFRGACAPGAAHYRALVDGVLDALPVEGQPGALVQNVENMFPELLDLGLGFDWSLFTDPAVEYGIPMGGAPA